MSLSTRERYIELARFLADRYFRARLVFRGRDTEFLSSRKPVIFISNHSGMNFPWDNIIMYTRITEFFGAGFKFMPLGTPGLYSSRILQPFAVANFWRMFSSPATSQNFEAMADAGYNIFLNPEGIAGIAKGFDKKYRLQRYSSSFVRVALKYRREIVPIYVINGEYLNPFAYGIQGVNKLAQKFGLPYIPMGLLTPVLSVFPFFLYVALPARLRYVLGEKIDLQALCDKHPDKMSTEELRAVAEKVRVIMQGELDRYVEEFGGVKFGWAEFAAEVWKSGRQALALLPLSWAYLFHQIDSDKTSGLSRKSWFAFVSMITPLAGWPLFAFYLGSNSAVEEKAKQSVDPARALDLREVA